MIETKNFAPDKPKKSILSRKPEAKQKSVSFADSFGFNLHDVKMFDRLEDFSHILFDLANLDWNCKFIEYNNSNYKSYHNQTSGNAFHGGITHCKSVDTLSELLNSKVKYWSAAGETDIYTARFCGISNLEKVSSTNESDNSKQLNIYHVPPLKVESTCPDRCQQTEVKLETLYHKSTFCLTGTVVVKNICFSKTVVVKITGNSWKNFESITASYQNAKCQHLDRFTFDVDLRVFTGGHRLPSTLKLPVTLELCINYTAGTDNLNFWDNNNGTNYKLYKVAI